MVEDAICVRDDIKEGMAPIKLRQNRVFLPATHPAADSFRNLSGFFAISSGVFTGGWS